MELVNSIHPKIVKEEYPLKQGLKPKYNSVFKLSKITVKEEYPLKQGLKRKILPPNYKLFL